MISFDRSRSRSLSTSTTSASRSWSAHGVRSPNECAIHLPWSASPLLSRTLPSAPYTQCRGNALAPARSTSPVPSGWSVSASVVQTRGACQRAYGACGTGRGSGIPVRPPTVWTKRTDPSTISGSLRNVGIEPARKVAPIRPTLTVVAPITSPLPGSKPWSTTRPSSTSAHAVSRFANRNLSSRQSSWTWSPPSTWSGRGWSQCESRRSIPVFRAPLSDSVGIHDIDTTVAWTRMGPNVVASGLDFARPPPLDSTSPATTERGSPGRTSRPRVRFLI